MPRSFFRRAQVLAEMENRIHDILIESLVSCKRFIDSEGLKQLKCSAQDDREEVREFFYGYSSLWLQFVLTDHDAVVLENVRRPQVWCRGRSSANRSCRRRCRCKFSTTVAVVVTIVITIVATINRLRCCGDGRNRLKMLRN